MQAACGAFAGSTIYTLLTHTAQQRCAPCAVGNPSSLVNGKGKEKRLSVLLREVTALEMINFPFLADSKSDFAGSQFYK